MQQSDTVAIFVAFIAGFKTINIIDGIMICIIMLEYQFVFCWLCKLLDNIWCAIRIGILSYKISCYLL